MFFWLFFILTSVGRLLHIITETNFEESLQEDKETFSSYSSTEMRKRNSSRGKKKKNYKVNREGYQQDNLAGI